MSDPHASVILAIYFWISNRGAVHAGREVSGEVQAAGPEGRPQGVQVAVMVTQVGMRVTQVGVRVGRK